MKKTHIILAAMLMFSITGLKAQFKYGPRMSIGSSNLGEGNSLIGGQLGLISNGELKDRFGVQGEVLFSVKTGYKNFESTNPVSGSTATYRTFYTFTYIDIPLYGYFPLCDHLTCLIGPQIGIVNKAKSRTTYGNVDVKEDIIGAKAKAGIAAGIDINLKSSYKFGLRFSTNGGDALGGKSTFVGLSLAYLLKW